MKIVSQTDIGLVRHSNQDACRDGVLPGGAVWAVVCDGMGGAQGGNVASSVAVDMISEQITSAYRENMSENSIKNLLTSAVYNANAAVFRKAMEDTALLGMGTTVVLALIADGTAYIAHVGDSRAYLITPNEIRQLTNDHSVVQEMIDHGELTHEQAKAHPRKNIITRALGVGAEVTADYSETAFGEEDRLLLCSDGLTNYLDAETLLSLSSLAELDDLGGLLVEAAKKLGGSDNITVVLIGR